MTYEERLKYFCEHCHDRQHCGYINRNMMGDCTCVAEVYKDKRDRISISDITQWCYLKDLHNLSNVQRTVKNWEEPVSEDLNTAAKVYADNITDKIGYKLQLRRAVAYGAEWQKEQFEKERLKHCDKLTAEQAQIESDFVIEHLKKNNRTPTFIDAIEYGMKLQMERDYKSTKNNT